MYHALQERQPWLQGRTWKLLEDPWAGVILLLVSGWCSHHNLVMARRCMELYCPATVLARTTWVRDTAVEVFDSTWRLGGWAAVQELVAESDR